MFVKVKLVENIPEFIDAVRLRADVFIKEQGFQAGWEPDEDDKISQQFIAVAGKEIVATARLRETEKSVFKIERMAVKKAYRKQNVGKKLLEHIIEFIRKKYFPKKIWAQSQVQAHEFYEKCGFKTASKPYDLWGCPHLDMEYIMK